MYNRVFQNCITISRKFCSNVLPHKIYYKSEAAKYIFSAHMRYAEHCSVIARCYCVRNRSEQTALDYKKKYEEKLNMFLKDPKKLMYYNKLKLEIEVLRSTTDRVPKNIAASSWFILFDTESKFRRRAFLEFLWRIEVKEAKGKQKKEEKRMLVESTPKTSQFSDENTMFLRIYDTKMNQFYNSKLINAILFEPTVVFDLGYENSMTKYEAQNCAKQLTLAFATNRIHPNPLNLYFCNTNMSGFVIEKLKLTMPTMCDEDFPLNITSESYLDLFDKDKLVYLTPHATNIMKSYDSNVTYIIGAMVDKVSPKPLSLAKAKKEGIKMAKFPLNQCLQWGGGSAKNLPINQVISILLDLRQYNDWNKAFEHIPKRKLQPARQLSLQKRTERRSRLIELLSKNE